MIYKIKLIFIQVFLTLVIFNQNVQAQEFPANQDSLAMTGYDATDLSILDELNLDSLTLLDLIDSLLSIQTISSQISINSGYISKITSSGRDLNANQYGYNLGIGYFHKSGIFMNLSGYWYSDFDPQYSLTTSSLGYLGTLSTLFAYIVSYDHSFYADKNLNAFNNTLNITTILDFEYIEPYLDYSLYFGNGTAHRLSPGFTFNFQIKDWWIFKSASFRPAFSIVYGNSEVVNARLLTTDNYLLNQYLDNRPVLKEKLESGLTEEQLEQLLTYYPRLAAYFDIENKNVFGVMNYNLSAPISISINSFRASFTYTYNIPKALPGELFELSPNDYISLSLSYKFKL